MYFDTTYIAKFYLNEPESRRVRSLAETAPSIYSSQWAFAEFHAVLARHVRESLLSRRQAADAASRFVEHLATGLWILEPVREAILRKSAAKMLSAPKTLFLRTADTVHLTTASEMGEPEIWTSDRHMFAAASYFGLTGRSI